MNWKFADFLVKLSDPETAARFAADPEATMAAASLSDGDRLALRTRNYGVIRYQAAHGDLEPISADRVRSDANAPVDFVHVEINHQSETSHDLVARDDEKIKRRQYGPHTTYYPEKEPNAA